MKYFHLVAILFLFGVISKADDGWQKAKWGMSPTQVTELYPDAIKLTEPNTYEQKGVKYSSPLRLPSYDLVGTRFFVDFLIDAQGNFAGTMLGTPATGGLQADSLEIEYRNLKELLTRKYAQPPSVEHKEGGGETSVWAAGKTEIRLNFTVSTFTGESGIRLLYLQIRDEELDKL